MNEKRSGLGRWSRRLAVISTLLIVTLACGSLLLSRADGPIFINDRPGIPSIPRPTIIADRKDAVFIPATI